MKLAWLRDSEKETLEPWQSVLSGAMAGALSAAVTTPLDVVKIRLMTQAHQTVSSAGMLGLKAEAAAQMQVLAAFTYKGVASTLQQVWVEEGAQGLMKGTAPRCFYSACFSALGFFTFETTQVHLLMKHLEKKKITLEEKLDVKLT